MRQVTIFTPIFCLIMYAAAKSEGVCRVLLLVLAHVAYGIYLCILWKTDWSIL